MRYSYCPQCGARLELTKIAGEDVQKCGQANCDFIFWRNSAPTASIVISNDKDEILICRRAIEPFLGKLDLPGGFLRLGEHPYNGARREAFEELQVDISIGGVLGFVMDEYGPGGSATLNIAMHAKIVGGAIKASDDVASCAWIDAKEIDRADLAFNNNAQVIDLYLNSRSPEVLK